MSSIENEGTLGTSTRVRVKLDETLDLRTFGIACKYYLWYIMVGLS